MKSNTRYKLVIGASMVLVAAAITVVIRLADQSLTGRGAVRLPCPDEDYVWAANDEIVTFTTRQVLVHNSSSDESDNSFRLVVTAKRTNLQSGGNTDLAELDNLSPAYRPMHAKGWTMSPNGHSLMFTLRESADDDSEASAMHTVWNLNSGDATPVDPEVYAGVDYTATEMLWMADNRRLVIGKDDNGNRAALYNMEAADDSCVAIPLEGLIKTTIGITPDNLLICSDLSRDSSGKVSLFEQGVYPSQLEERKFTPSLPSNAAVTEISLSPKGDRLAWTISTIHASPFYQFVHRIAPRFAGKLAPRPVTSIYLSRIDGRDMRLVGMEDNPGKGLADLVRHVRWRPDSKQISYRWHNAIYAIPIPVD